jgi:hypothetical protein
MKLNRLKTRVNTRQRQKLQNIAKVFTLVAVIATTLTLYNMLGVSKTSKADNLELNTQNRLEGFSYVTSLSINYDALELKANFMENTILAEIQSDELKYYTKGGLMQIEDASDLIFTLEDGITTLPHYIERYDPSKGKVLVWLKVPELNKERLKSVLMYAGNNLFSEKNTENVFNNPLKSVFHLNNDFKDALSNEVFGEVYGVKDDEGKIAAGKSFHSYAQSNAVMNVPALKNYEGSLSVSFWINPSEMKNKSLPLAQLGRNGGFNFKLNSDNEITFEIRNEKQKSADVSTKSAIKSSAWTMVTGVFDASKDSLYIYVNGENAAQAKAGVRYHADGKLHIGGGTGMYFDGMMDEIQISFEALSPLKARLNFANQNNPTQFFNIGNQEYLKAPEGIVAFNSFDAEARSGHVLLSWATRYEQNVDLFRIERSVDGENFEKIAGQFATGNTNEPRNYFIIDPKPLNETAYYRITGIGFNNELVCSNIQSVSYIANDKPVVIDAVEPNPFENNFEVTYKLNRPTTAVLSITNIHGERVHEATVDHQSEKYSFDHGNKLLPGIYFISLKQDNEQHTLRLVKKTK